MQQLAIGRPIRACVPYGGLTSCLVPLQPEKAAGAAAKGGLKRLRKASESLPGAEPKRGKAEADAAELMDDIPSPAKARPRETSCVA